MCKLTVSVLCLHRAFLLPGLVANLPTQTSASIKTCLN